MSKVFIFYNIVYCIGDGNVVSVFVMDGVFRVLVVNNSSDARDGRGGA